MMSRTCPGGGTEKDLAEAAEHRRRPVASFHGRERRLRVSVIEVNGRGEGQELAPGVLHHRSILGPGVEHHLVPARD